MSSECSSGIAFAEGNLIKGYKIEKAFPPGSTSFVGKAVAQNGRPVFFKKYRSPGASTPWLDAFIRYQQELKSRIESNPAAKNLCYEFIEFFDLKKTGGIMPLRAFYQVFEWVEGGMDMRKVLDELRHDPRAYDWKQRVIFARVMVAAVNAIHQAGVIHTDLKPENLYLIPDPAISAKYKLRVIDFDCALMDGRQAPWHGHKGYFGTPGYMSPEHLSGDVPGRASDVFTCALMLGELIGDGHPCGGAMDEYDERVKKGTLARVTIRERVDGCPDPDFLNRIINRCFSKDQRERPTAGELLLALNGRLHEFRGDRPKGLGGGDIPPPTPPPPPPHSVSSKGVTLRAPSGQTISINIEARMGNSTFKSWGEDYRKFVSAEQFRFFKSGDVWMVEHCQGAKNQSNIDGHPLNSAVPIRSGMVLSVGKTKKCPVQMQLS